MQVPDYFIQGGITVIFTLANAYVLNYIRKNEEKSDIADGRIEKKFDDMYKDLDIKIHENQKLIKSEVDKNDDKVWLEIKDLLKMFRANDRELYKMVGTLEKILERLKGRAEAERDNRQERNFENLINSIKRIRKSGKRRKKD